MTIKAIKDELIDKLLDFKDVRGDDRLTKIFRLIKFLVTIIRKTLPEELWEVPGAYYKGKEIENFEASFREEFRIYIIILAEFGLHVKDTNENFL